MTSPRLRLATVHLVALSVPFGALVLQSICQNGIDSSSQVREAQVMSLPLLVTAWALVSPTLLLELWALGHRIMKAAYLGAFIGGTILGWFGALPAAQFLNPVPIQDLVSAAATYLVLLVGYVVMIVVGIFLLSDEPEDQA